MNEIAASLEASAIAEALRSSFFAYPVVSAMHILGAGGLVAIVWIMHAARFDKRFGSEIFHRRMAVAAIVGMGLTGLALLTVQASDYLSNPAFRIKMALLAVALANAAIHYGLTGHDARMRRGMMALSAIAWPAVLAAGRFIGFV